MASRQQQACCPRDFAPRPVMGKLQSDQNNQSSSVYRSLTGEGGEGGSVHPERLKAPHLWAGRQMIQSVRLAAALQNQLACRPVELS